MVELLLRIERSRVRKVLGAVFSPPIVVVGFVMKTYAVLSLRLVCIVLFLPLLGAGCREVLVAHRGERFVVGYTTRVYPGDGNSSWARVDFVDRCEEGWKMRLQVKVEPTVNDRQRLSVVVLGEVKGEEYWRTGKVLAVLDGGVDDLVVVVPCVEQMNIGVYLNPPDASSYSKLWVQPIFVDEEGREVPGMAPLGEFFLGGFCYPNCKIQ